MVPTIIKVISISLNPSSPRGTSKVPLFRFGPKDEIRAFLLGE
jgi:hypothetical protein